MIKEHLMDIGYVRRPLDAISHPKARSIEELKKYLFSESDFARYVVDSDGEWLAAQFVGQVPDTQEGDMAILLIGEAHVYAVGSRLSDRYQPFFVIDYSAKPNDPNKRSYVEELRLRSSRYKINTRCRKGSGKWDRYALIIGEVHMVDFPFNLPDIGVLRNSGIRRAIIGLENHTTPEAKQEGCPTFHYNCRRLMDYAAELRKSDLPVNFFGLDNGPRPVR